MSYLVHVYPSDMGQAGVGTLPNWSFLSLDNYYLCLFSVQPNKEIKIVSAVRRSSITSLAGNSNPYFSVTPTLVFPPVAECNPKSGRGFCTALLLLRVRLFPLGTS